MLLEEWMEGWEESGVHKINILKIINLRVKIIEDLFVYYK